MEEKQYSIVTLKTGELKALIDLGIGKHVAFVVEDEEGLLNFLELKEIKKNTQSEQADGGIGNQNNQPSSNQNNSGIVAEESEEDS